MLSEEVIETGEGGKPRVVATRTMAQMVEPEVYTKARPTALREEYIPPRALASRPTRPGEDPEDINKGCYYFMACLDSFWIL